MASAGATIERLVDDQLAKRAMRIEDFDPILERLYQARVRGLRSLRRIVAARDSKAYQPPTSELERLLYKLLDHPEIPQAARQMPIDYPELKTTVDAYIAGWRMIVEADGRRWHTREKDFEKDRARDHGAATAGLLVIRFTYRMLKEEPLQCLETLQRSGIWRHAS